MGRKKSQNSLNSCYGIRLTEEQFGRINSLSKSDKEFFNKTLRKVIGRLLNKINGEENDSQEINVDENNNTSKIVVNKNNSHEINTDTNKSANNSKIVLIFV